MHVYVDNTVEHGTRPVVAMPDEIRRAVEPLLR